MKIIFENSTLGECTIHTEDQAKEYVEALIMLGWEPRVEMEQA